MGVHPRCLALILALLPLAGAEVFGSQNHPAPPEELHPEIRVMRTFAPILWLATDEPTIPTLPHPLAFDGENNFGAAGKDLESFPEIEWDIEAPFEHVVRVIDEQKRLGRLRARVIYKLPSLPPTWSRRFGDRYVYALEYWFYYPYDRGLGGGHKGDSEHAFVFVAIEKELERYEDLLEGRVVGVVGAGHETHTANNVLVATSSPNPRGEIFPTELPQHIPILVERGKHASAPDRNFDGRFAIGADVNLFRDAAWGSRDVYPDSVFHIIGDFEDWYSLPRNDHDIWMESQSFDEEFYEGYTASYPSRFPPGGASSSYPNRYTLFPRSDLACLYQLLGREENPDPACSGSVEDFLSEHKDCFWLENAPTSIALDPNVLAALRRWPDRGEWEGGTHHLSLLDHRDAQDPRNIFKLHLYPTVSLGGGLQWDGGSGSLLHLSTRVAEITTSDAQWFPNSMIEINADFNMDPWTFHDVEFHYLFFRGGYAGFFAGTSMRRERLSSTFDLSPEEAEEAVMRIGTDLPDRDSLSRTRWAIDAGWAISFNFMKLHQDVFLDTKIGLRADLFNDPPSDLELALGAQRQFRLLVSVGIRKGIAFPLNPLSY